MRFATTEERDTTMQYGVEEGAKGGFARIDALLAAAGARRVAADDALRKEVRPMKTMTCRQLGGPCDLPHHWAWTSELAPVWTGGFQLTLQHQRGFGGCNAGPEADAGGRGSG